MRVTTLPESGYLKLQSINPGLPIPGAIALAVSDAAPGTLVALRSSLLGHLKLHNGLSQDLENLTPETDFAPNTEPMNENQKGHLADGRLEDTSSTC